MAELGVGGAYKDEATEPGPRTIGDTAFGEMLPDHRNVVTLDGHRAHGPSPKGSVLSTHNQVWDAASVFVTDGACMASTACQNPSLTSVALTARAAGF